MADRETRLLDSKILSFIRRHDTRPSSDDAFGELALRVFEFQYRRNANYRRFCRVSGADPRRLTKWQEIPAMPAAAFKEIVLTTFAQKKAKKSFRTSGTTSPELARCGRLPGWAGRGVHFFDTLSLYEAAIEPPFRSAFLADGAKPVPFFLVSTPREVPDSSLSHMAGVVDAMLGKKGRWHVNDGELKSEALARELASAKRPVLVFATAFSLKAFLDFLEARAVRLKLPAGSRLMETGGFKGRVKDVSKPSLYTACETYLGIKSSFCVSEYGMTELSSQFYDASAGRRGDRSFGGPAWTRTLAVDPATGKPARAGKRGLLRHFDLANRGSVMAIQTEDVGVTSADGRFRLLGRARGSEIRGCSLAYEEFLTTAPEGELV